MNKFIKASTRWLIADHLFSFLKSILIMVAFVGLNGQAAALTAYEQFLEKANSGDLAAMNMVGNILKTGTGGAQKDLLGSKKWFENAAEKGYAPSAFNLGLMFETGAAGIEKDLSLARKYYQQSSDAGFQKATERLRTLENSPRALTTSKTSPQSGGGISQEPLRQVENQDSRSEMEKGIWTDPKTGLTWMRCLMDQQWTGTSCQGRPEIRNWWESLYAVKSLRFAGYNDWRLPSFQDLNGIRRCRLLQQQSTGTIASGEFTYHPFCAERTTPIDVSIFVGLIETKDSEMVWSSNRSIKHSADAYTLCFSKSCLGSYAGLLDISGKHSKDSRFPRYILAVRGGQPEGDYESALVEAMAVVKKELTAKADKEAREKAETTRIRLAQEADEKRLSELLNSGNPQTMYLAAGTFGRNGDSYKAKQVYEAIISRYPSSSWAVKANDQLNDTKRSNDAESAANQRQYNSQRTNQEAESKSKSQCSYRIDKCEDSCRPLSGSSKSACWSSCKSLCNQF